MKTWKLIQMSKKKNVYCLDKQRNMGSLLSRKAVANSSDPFFFFFFLTLFGRRRLWSGV